MTIPRYARRLAYWRKRRGLSQKSLAAIAEVGPSMVSQVEAGIKHLPIWRLERIARRLGLSMSAFYGDARATGRDHEDDFNTDAPGLQPVPSEPTTGKETP